MVMLTLWRTIVAHADLRILDRAASSQPPGRPTAGSAPTRFPGSPETAGRDPNRRARTADQGIGVEGARADGVADRADLRLYGLPSQQAGARGCAARFPPLRPALQPQLHG